MEIKETYHFLPRDFDINGKRVSDGTPFREILKEFERDFHTRHSNYYATFLFANSQMMLLLSRSCNAKENMIYGMDLIGVNGDFEPNINHRIEEASNKRNIVVYGIDSAFMLPDKNGTPRIDEEKMIYPLTLLIDNNMKDGMLYLKYLDDDRNDEDCMTPINVDENSLKFIKWK
jgi:hypothetical protein